MLFFLHLYFAQNPQNGQKWVLILVNNKYRQSKNNFEESMDKFEALATAFEKMKFTVSMKTNFDDIMKWIQSIINETLTWKYW